MRNSSPMEACGVVDGARFYFSCRWDRWRFSVPRDASDPPHLDFPGLGYVVEQLYTDVHGAGTMTEQEAHLIIRRCAREYYMRKNGFGFRTPHEAFLCPLHLIELMHSTSDWATESLPSEDLIGQSGQLDIRAKERRSAPSNHSVSKLPFSVPSCPLYPLHDARSFGDERFPPSFFLKVKPGGMTAFVIPAMLFFEARR